MPQLNRLYFTQQADPVKLEPSRLLLCRDWDGDGRQDIMLAILAIAPITATSGDNPVWTRLRLTRQRYPSHPSGRTARYRSCRKDANGRATVLSVADWDGDGL